MAQTPEIATKPRQNMAEVFYADLENYTANLRDALPADIPVERFKRVLVTAVSQNPELLYADRRSLFNASVRCAVDGLIPDGRQAALVVFRTDVKQRDPQTGVDHIRKVDMVQYMPMVAGLRERMRKSGEVASAVAEAVFERDDFRYRLGDDPFIEHVPPPLGTPRGMVIGAYAIIRLKNGEVIRDVLDRPTIEAARAVSRAKNSPMWQNFYWEGAKKTALRRASKQAPFSSELRQVLERDEEPPEIGPDLGPGLLRNQEPEPQREQYQSSRVEPTGPEFAIVDLDGIENIYTTAPAAAEALRLCLEDAARLGPDRIDGWWESNNHAIEFLGAAGFGDLAADLTRAYEEKKPKPAGSSQQGAPDPGPPTAQGPGRGSSRPFATSATQQSGGDGGNGDAGTKAGAGPSATTVASPSDAEPEIDHRMPPTEPPPPADLEIAVPMKNRREDWRTWGLVLLASKIRRCTSGNDLAALLGANEQNLERAVSSLAPADREDMERVIAEQWQKLPA